MTQTLETEKSISKELVGRNRQWLQKQQVRWTKVKEVLHGTAYFDDDRSFECCAIIPSLCWVKDVSQDDLDAEENNLSCGKLGNPSSESSLSSIFIDRLSEGAALVDSVCLPFGLLSFEMSVGLFDDHCITGLVLFEPLPYPCWLLTQWLYFRLHLKQQFVVLLVVLGYSSPRNQRSQTWLFLVYSMPTLTK